jgi:hypothetical protein
MNATKQLGIMALGMMFAVSVAVGQVSLPQATGFDESYDGLTVTVNDGTEEALFSFETAGALEGTHYLQMREGEEPPTLTINNFAAGASNVWWRGFARVSAEAQGSTPDAGDIAGATAAFFVEDDDGTFRLHARSDDQWVALTTLTDPTDNWHGYAVHLDYGSKTWDLYVTSGGLSSTLVKANTGGPLAFNDTASALTFSELTVMYDTDIDAFNFLTGAGAVTAHTPNEIKPVTVSHTTNKWYASKVADKDYDGENNLGSALGADLAAGLIPGDRMRVYTDNGWQVFVLEADGLWTNESGGDTPGGVSMVAGEPVWFEYSSVITDAFAFFDPDYDPATLPGTVIERGAVSIRPTGGTAQGWTTLRWDGSRSRQIHPNNTANFPQEDLDSGSVIIVIRSDGTFTRGFWTGGSEGTWETIGGVPIVLEPGNTIWIYNSGTGTDWTPSY